jgi:hypothetical protein
MTSSGNEEPGRANCSFRASTSAIVVVLWLGVVGVEMLSGTRSGRRDAAKLTRTRFARAFGGHEPRSGLSLRKKDTSWTLMGAVVLSRLGSSFASTTPLPSAPFSHSLDFLLPCSYIHHGKRCG